MNKNKLTKNLLIITIFLSLFLISLSSASAAETNITSSDNLGQIVQNASSGDTINLDNGTYTNNITNITVDKNLTIAGKNPQNTIIDAQRLGRIFNITGGNRLNLINITIANGYINGSGGAIYNIGQLTLTNCIFTNNSIVGPATTRQGGAIYNAGNNLLINDSQFLNNFATGPGGAIYNIGNNLSVSGSEFVNNSANGGGAIYNFNCVNFTVVKTIFYNNKANNLSDGGAIRNFNVSNINITSCEFRDNTGTRYGGAIYNVRVTLTMNDCNFTNNSIPEYGGAVYFDFSNTTIINSNLIDNKAVYGSGAIFNANGNMTINNTNFTNNFAEGSGGAIDNLLANMSITNCNFKNNTADYGGAVYSSGGNLKIANSNFINNPADYGGAVYSYEDKFSQVINSNFIENDAISGGAIYNYLSSMNITNSKFDGNSAEFVGGAIDNEGTTTINNSNFTNNVAEFGGAIYNYDCILNLNNSKFTDNIATYDGGALYNDELSDINITNSNFTGNLAIEGGAIYDISNNLFIIGCNIINNSNGIYISVDSNNVTINYNRIFNNTDYDLNNAGINTNADYNWWGDNTPDMTKIIGTILNNYFVMNVTNLTSTVTNGSAVFNYTFGLNNNEAFDPSLLPYFVTNVYTNITSGIQETFDARFNRTVTVDTNRVGQNVTYTFVTDNEVKNISLFVESTSTNLEVNNPSGRDGDTVDLIARLTDANGNPIAGKLITFHVGSMTLTAITDANGIATVQYTINTDDFTNGQLTFTATFEGDENYSASTATGIITLIEEPPIPPTPPTPTPTPENETNETSENPTAISQATMKKTGIPINIILLVLLSVLSVLISRKQN